VGDWLSDAMGGGSPRRAPLAYYLPPQPPRASLATLQVPCWATDVTPVQRASASAVCANKLEAIHPWQHAFRQQTCIPCGRLCVSLSASCMSSTRL